MSLQLYVMEETEIDNLDDLLERNIILFGLIELLLSQFNLSNQMYESR